MKTMEFKEENKVRDLRKDREICNGATRGPWHATTCGSPAGGEVIADDGRSIGTVISSRIIPGIIFEVYDKDALRTEPEANANAAFVAEARLGWPEAIDRAIAAEEKVSELENTINEMVSINKVMPQNKPRCHRCGRVVDTVKVYKGILCYKCLWEKAEKKLNIVAGACLDVVDKLDNEMGFQPEEAEKAVNLLIAVMGVDWFREQALSRS